MIKLSGKKEVAKSPAELWKLLMDPRTLRECIPGCDELELDGPGKYRIALKVGVGPVKGSFKGHAELKDVEEPVKYTLEVRAKGLTGFIDGSTRVRLAPAGGGKSTELSYESEARVGGVLASVGARLFEGAARSFTEEFFDKLAER
jgi:carbon monoxide dehydrogenase subunit G